VYAFLSSPYPAHLIPKNILQRICQSLRPCVTFRHMQIFYGGGFVTPSPNLQAAGPPLGGCPRLLTLYIPSYPPHLEAVSSTHNLRTRHALLTKYSLNMGFQVKRFKSI
jgi:hypothetical protein